MESFDAVPDQNQPDQLQPDRQKVTCVARVFGGNALAVGDLSPARLAALGFAQGDGETFVHVEHSGAVDAADAPREPQTIDPSAVSWTPMLS